MAGYWQCSPVWNRMRSYWRQPIREEPIMKILPLAIGLASLGFANSVWAYHFEPTNTAFKAHGAFTVTAGAVSLPCTAHFQGTTVGGAQITSARFSGISCVALTASGLPWAITTHSADGATIN